MSVSTIECNVILIRKCSAAVTPDILTFHLCEVGVETVAQGRLHIYVRHLPERGNKGNQFNYLYKWSYVFDLF